MLLVLLTSGALSDPVLFGTIVQHRLLAIDRDRIAVGLSLESPPARVHMAMYVRIDSKMCITQTPQM